MLGTPTQTKGRAGGTHLVVAERHLAVISASDLEVADGVALDEDSERVGMRSVLARAGPHQEVALLSGTVQRHGFFPMVEKPFLKSFETRF